MGFDKEMRPPLVPPARFSGVQNATTATTVSPGLVALNATSTAGPIVIEISRLPKLGDVLAIHAVTNAATSAGAGYHINAYAGSFFGSSSQDMATILDKGGGFYAIAMSTTRWGVIGNNSVTFSTST